MKIQNKQLNKGFTIIETLVAVFVLSIAITAFMSLTSQSIMTARYARNEITANYLAQEAADYIRNQRDELAFSSSGSWANFKNSFSQTGKSCFSSNGCYIDVSTSTITSCSSSGCPLLDYRPSGSSFYYYNVNNNTTDSVFKRTIIMNNSTSNSTGTDEVYITVTIDWKNGGVSKSKVLNFSLLNWYKF